jgi:hypothetical protein
MRKLKQMLLEEEFEVVYSYVKKNKRKIDLDELINQKVLLKIFNNENFSNIQKEELVKEFSLNNDEMNIELGNLWQFIKNYFSIANEIRMQIRNSLILNFDSSLSQFNYYWGLFVAENPDVILLAKNIIMSIAKNVLSNDFIKNPEINKRLILPSISQKLKILESLYNIAIKCGVIYEQFDFISYERLKIVDIFTYMNKPIVKLKLINEPLEKSIMIGSLHDYFVQKSKIDLE